MTKKSSKKKYMQGLSRRTFVIVSILSLAIFLTTSSIKISNYSPIQTAFGKGSGSEDKTPTPQATSGSGGGLSNDDDVPSQENNVQSQSGNSSLIQTVQNLLAPSSDNEKSNKDKNDDKNKSETKIKNGSTEIETKSENGKTETEIKQGSVKIKFKFEDGKLVVKTENEAGEEVEANKSEIEDAENELEKEDIKIASGESGIAFSRHNVAALSSFPLSVTSTNQLVVTTPAGQKVVAVLPDQAISALLASGLVSSITSATGSSALGVATQSGTMSLVMKDNQPAYQIEGEKVLKLFGLFPVTTSTTAFVSADTGNVIAEQKSLLATILGIFSR